MGRKFKPAAVHEAEGNPGKRPIKQEPKPKQTAPKCPKDLDPAARLVWKRVIKELKIMGVVFDADRDLLIAYCHAVADYAEACRRVAKEGLTTETIQGGLKTHPCASLKKELAALIAKLGSELGLTPSGRASLGKPLENPNRPRDKRAKLVALIGKGQAA